MGNRSAGEFASHCLLAQYNLAPPLLARFQNGLLYNFIQGRVCTSSDLRREPVWRGIARRLGEWHAVLPTATGDVRASTRKDGRKASRGVSNGTATTTVTKGDETNGYGAHTIDIDKPSPDIWGVMQKWVDALPDANATERKRRGILQDELNRLVKELSSVSSLGKGRVSRASPKWWR